MNETKIYPLKLLAEISAIVFGILLAFALDAWWDGQRTRQWELTQLEALRDEFERNFSVLDRVVESHDRNARGIEQLISRATGATGQDVFFESHLLGSLFNWRTAEVSMGALQALLSSGELNSIRHAELRYLLADWPARVGDSDEEEIILQQFVELELAPSLLGAGVLSSGYQGRHPALGGYEPDDAVQKNDVTVTITTELLELATVRLIHERMARRSNVRLQQRIKEILALIDSELEGA